MPDPYSSYDEEQARAMAALKQTTGQQARGSAYASRFGTGPGALEDPYSETNQARLAQFRYLDRNAAFAEDMRRRAMSGESSAALVHAAQGRGAAMDQARMQSGDVNDPLAARRAMYMAQQGTMPAIAGAARSRAQEMATAEQAYQGQLQQYASTEMDVQRQAAMIRSAEAKKATQADAARMAEEQDKQEAEYKAVMDAIPLISDIRAKEDIEPSRVTHGKLRTR
jgi:hypothetical protein